MAQLSSFFLSSPSALRFLTINPPYFWVFDVVFLNRRSSSFPRTFLEFGGGIIDVDELASIYNFRIDKFQRQAVQAFLRGSSVVVSVPTSGGKTLIAEAAAVATVAKGKRLFYTTPLKASSNQKFREFSFPVYYVTLRDSSEYVFRDYVRQSRDDYNC